MKDHGGLPAIHPYDIGRHAWLHELRQARAFKRVHGIVHKSVKEYQRELCKLRKEYYHVA